MIRYLDFLSGELRVRRLQLGLKHSDGGLVIFDQAGATCPPLFRSCRPNGPINAMLTLSLQLILLALVSLCELTHSFKIE